MAKEFGKWTVLEQIDEGGQGYALLVYETNDPERKPFVLKKLKNKKRLHRFKKEVKAGLDLSHPNILKIVDKDLEHDPAYFVAEYCSGGSLRPTVMSALTIVERLQMFFLVCQGIAYAHSKGVIHRDLKPANIFLKGDLRTPVIGDFGICFIDDDGERMTMVEEVAGSRWYTAPELSHGIAENVTTLADVYSLGKVLYWMLAGRIFDREIHRDQRFDLTKNAVRPDYFFIYDLLDKTIVENSSGRMSNVTEVANAIDSIIGRIQMKAHHIDLSTPQACTYCGVGFYQPVVNDPERMLYPLNYSKTKNFGLEPKGNFEGPSDWIPFWLVLVCDYCGNVQMFRPDYAKDKEIWRKQ